MIRPLALALSLALTAPAAAEVTRAAATALAPAEAMFVQMFGMAKPWNPARAAQAVEASARKWTRFLATGRPGQAVLSTAAGEVVLIEQAAGEPPVPACRLALPGATAEEIAAHFAATPRQTARPPLTVSTFDTGEGPPRWAVGVATFTPYAFGTPQTPPAVMLSPKP